MKSALAGWAEWRAYFTTTVTVALWLWLPDVPVIVSVYVPAGVPVGVPGVVVLEPLAPVLPQPTTPIASSASAGKARASRKRRFGVNEIRSRANAAKIVVSQTVGFGHEPRLCGGTNRVARAVDVTETCAVTLLPFGLAEPGVTLHVEPVGAPEQASETA